MLDVLWSVASFIVAIGVLVSFHEFGHFWVARRCGVKVLRFSIGFGRPLFGWKDRQGCEYVVAAIPLGGYVKMLDEREGDVPEALLSQTFNRKSVWARIAIVAAGPIFNFLLAIVFYWAVFVVGVQGWRPVIAEPAAGSVAAAAGLQAQDEVISLNGKAIATWQALRAGLIDGVLDGDDQQLLLRRADGSEFSADLPTAGVSAEPERLFAELGMNQYQPSIPPVLQEVIPNLAAEAAGFQPGDRLLRYDDQPIVSWQQWAQWVRANPGELVTVDVQRGSQQLQLRVIIGQQGQGSAVSGQFGAAVEVPSQLWQDLRAEQRLGMGAAAGAAVAQTWQMSKLTLRMLYRMVVGDVSVKNISGPIQIAQYAGYTASVGLVSFLSFMAIVSVSLGVLNLLPIPLLDGGHLLYYLVEAVTGTPVSERVQIVGQQVGLTLLVLMMGLAFYNDIMRLVG